MQANPKKYNKGMIQASADIIKEQGPGALLGGLGPTVVGYGIEGAMKFGVYEVMKPVFAALLVSEGSNNKGPAYLLASIVAGSVAAMLLCPMESTRIKIVTDPNYAGRGLSSALPKLLKEEGLASTFAGLWAMLAKQVPYTFGKQVSFDVFAALMYAAFSAMQENMAFLSDSVVKWGVSVFAAMAASLIACLLSQPGDMILTETYKPSSSVKQQQRSFTQIIADIHGTGGVGNFFTGTSARIVHVGLIITSQLVIYDLVKQLLGLPATGAH
jgi:solute carrier family 25 phosphate transporter 3